MIFMRTLLLLFEGNFFKDSTKLKQNKVSESFSSTLFRGVVCSSVRSALVRASFKSPFGCFLFLLIFCFDCILKDTGELAVLGDCSRELNEEQDGDNNGEAWF